MTTLETELEQPLSQNSLLFLDCLYCEEKCWDEEDDDVHHDDDDDNGVFGSSNMSLLYDYPCYCENEEEEQLNALFSKEEKTIFNEGDLGANKSLMEARREALEWMIRVNSHHNFSPMTLVLGVNYFDRFMLSFGYQREKPWMTHLAAVACLSLASKVEETCVPLLLDFQVEHTQIYEAKVIQRMELLVLSTLEWKMNVVTPLSYFGYLIRKLMLKKQFHWKILCRCESLILSAILDPRFLCYVPSVLASATMLQTLKEIGLWSTLEHQNDVMDTLKLDKVKVEECYTFIQELSSNEKANKRKCYTSASRSPNNVLDIVSNESSKKELSSMTLLMPSSEPQPKKCRTVGPTCFV